MPWKVLSGIALEICGGVELKKQMGMLKRLRDKWGSVETERMLRGALALGWKDLRALCSTEGIGRRMALQKFWSGQKREPPAESVRSIFKGWGK